MDPRLLADARDAVFWTTRRLHMTIPSVLAAGDALALRITAIGPDGLPDGGFRREIVFADSPGVEGLPPSVRVGADGHATVEGLKAVGPDHAFIVARPEGIPEEFCVRSNPAWVFAEPPWRQFWGDLHVHTTYSNCSAWACKDPEFAYAYARDVGQLDFAAPADHLRGIAADAARWPRLQRLARTYDDPGRFATFLAFESSHAAGFGGDINAYYLNDDAPHFWLDREDMRGVAPKVTLRQLWDFLDATGSAYFTAPHHTGRAGKYRSFADPAYDAAREPVFEIFSMWGSSEARSTRLPLYAGNTDEPAYFQDALRAGCRYGVIASSDDHQTLPGGEGKQRNPADAWKVAQYVHHGLAAVRAKELTRGAVFHAIRSRACYATTFARTLLDVRIGDLSMGQEAKLQPKDSLRRRREIRVRLLATDFPKAEVTLLRNGAEIARKPWKLGETEVLFTDEAPLERIALRDAPHHGGPFVAYYVRVANIAEQTQWSSPIWLDL